MDLNGMANLLKNILANSISGWHRWSNWRSIWICSAIDELKLSPLGSCFLLEKMSLRISKCFDRHHFMVILCHTQKEGSFFDMFLIRSESCKIKRQVMEMLKCPRKFRKKKTLWIEPLKRANPKKRRPNKFMTNFTSQMSSVRDSSVIHDMVGWGSNLHLDLFVATKMHSLRQGKQLPWKATPWIYSTGWSSMIAVIPFTGASDMMLLKLSGQPKCLMPSKHAGCVFCG